MDQTQTGARSRTFTWSDPTVHAAHVGRRSGLALLRAMTDGELPPPPVLQMLGVDGFEVEEGRVAVFLTPQEFHYNPLGTVHGGVLATVLDTATGCAVHSVLPAGVRDTAVDLTPKVLRPGTVDPGGPRCAGTLLLLRRRHGPAAATLT